MLTRPRLLAVNTWWGLSSHPTRGQSVPRGAVGAVGWHPTGIWGARGHHIAYFGLGVAAAGAGVAAQGHSLFYGEVPEVDTGLGFPPWGYWAPFQQCLCHFSPAETLEL